LAFKKFGAKILAQKFWRKNFGAKFASKMLMKFTKGVNFMNILCTTFLYKSALRSFSPLTFWLCNFLSKEYQRKSC